MSYREILGRELEVAFSKNAQPVWFRVVKYMVLGVLVYLYWDTSTLWITLGVILMLGIPVHMWYRHKTRGWTRSYGGWNYEKNKPKQVRKNP